MGMNRYLLASVVICCLAVLFAVACLMRLCRQEWAVRPSAVRDWRDVLEWLEAKESRQW